MTRHSVACVCSADCRARHARYQRLRKRDQILGRPRLVPAVGTRRRLQALIVAGWSWRQLNAAYGVDQSALQQLIRRADADVYETTASGVRALYAQLVDAQPPGYHLQAHEQARAVARGWQPPEAWLTDDDMDNPAAEPYLGDDDRPDEVLVDRMRAGTASRADLEELRSLPWRERLPLIERWLQLGRSLAELDRAGWNPHRDRRLYSGRVAA